jgi:hypothetical protein
VAQFLLHRFSSVAGARLPPDRDGGHNQIIFMVHKAA